jgi:hypothetical protein
MRLGHQLVDGSWAATPHHVVGRLLGMQAQDYLGALWSVGLRLPGATVATVEAAIADRSIVRTWPMRGTLHFVPAEDVRWLLPLLTPRIVARAAGRHAQLGLTEKTFARGRELFTEALAGGRRLTRPQAMALLETGGISTVGQRGYHILWRLSQEGLLCCGPMEGRQQTFVLLDEWVPLGSSAQDAPPRDEALARLAARYFAGHGPATLADFAWWSGLTKTDARAGLDAVTEGLAYSDVDGARYWWASDDGDSARAAAPDRGAPGVHLLPGFDEFMLGYTDRTLQLGEHHETYSATVMANGMFSGTVAFDGAIAGTWKRTIKRDRVGIAVRAFRQFTAAESAGVAEAAARFGAYLGLTPDVRL